MIHGESQESRRQVVKANQTSLNPGEEEDHDLPLVLVPHHGEDVLELVVGAGRHLDFSDLVQLLKRFVSSLHSRSKYRWFPGLFVDYSNDCSKPLMFTPS